MFCKTHYELWCFFSLLLFICHVFFSIYFSDFFLSEFIICSLYICFQFSAVEAIETNFAGVLKYFHACRSTRVSRCTVFVDDTKEIHSIMVRACFSMALSECCRRLLITQTDCRAWRMACTLFQMSAYIIIKCGLDSFQQFLQREEPNLFNWLTAGALATAVVDCATPYLFEGNF